MHGNKQEMHVQGHLRDSVIRQSKVGALPAEGIEKVQGRKGHRTGP